MVGDTMDTDVLGGVGMGYQTILVLSGHTRIEDLHHYAYRPDWIIPSVAHMPDEIFRNRTTRAALNLPNHSRIPQESR